MVSRPVGWILGALVAAGTEATTVHAAQATVRVSVDSSGAEADGPSFISSLSADGRYVAFMSAAANLVPGDGNGDWDFFVHDRVTGATERVSVDSNGNEANSGSGSYTHQSLSGDGMVVAFYSLATNLDVNDMNGFADVFVHDRRSGVTTRVSVDSYGVEGDGDSDGACISGDGRVVGFSSYADNLDLGDTNGQDDAFVRDVSIGSTERVSVDSSGNEGNGRSRLSSISSDGRYVTFFSDASNLVHRDKNGASDVFIRDRLLGTTERVSVDSNGMEGNAPSGDSSISADGRFVAFNSRAANLVPQDLNNYVDVFVRDRSAGTTTRVSVGPYGVEANADCWEPVISSDGRYVIFSTQASSLCFGDDNGFLDAYRHDMKTGETILCSVDSAGLQGNLGSAANGISSNGNVISFASLATNLVPSDGNGECDTFVHELCGTPATWSNYGAGLSGTYGVPSFTAQQFPAFGATVIVDLANSLGAPTVGLLVVGFQRANLPTHFGSDLLVLPAVIQPITFSYGGDSFTGTIPDDIDLCGVTIDLQGIELDSGAAFGVSFSQGLEFVIGN